MTLIQNPALFTLSGLAVVTAIDSLGAVASRKFRFPYTRLALLSLFFYVVMGFLVSRHFDLSTVLFTNAIIGFYDGTIGWKLSILLGANMDEQQSQLQNMPIIYLGIVMVIIAAVMGYIGHLAA